MKQLYSILLILISLAARASFTVTNEVNYTIDETSWDTQPYHLSGDYMATYFYCMYPQYTNHIYSVSRSGASWQNQFESQQQKYCLPLWASYNVDSYDLMMASENGGYNTTNPVIQWGTNLFNAPPLFWDGTSITNEGAIVPHTITHLAIGCFPDSTNGVPGNLQLDIGCQMLNAIYGQPPYPLYTNLYTPYWSNDWSSGANNIQFYTGGHPNPAGHLDMALQTLLNLGVETNVGSMVFDWNNSAAYTNKFALSGFSRVGNVLSTTFKADRMPLAWDVAGDVTTDGTITNDARGGIATIPKLGNSFLWMLQVTNLPTATYTVAIDGSNILTCSSAFLAAGWNMFTNYSGPLWAQRVAVLSWKRYQNGCNLVTLNDYSPNVSEAIPGVGRLVEFQSNGNQQYDVNGKRGSTYVSAMATFVSNLQQYDVKIQQAAIQTNHTLTISFSQPRYAPVKLR